MNRDLAKRLKQVVHQAQVRLDLETAQNTELQRAIHVVESYLKKTGRVCYGGQAINAQLPDKDKFYNENTSLPDYDFFSPDQKEDSNRIIHDLKQAGFAEISKRVGIHEGTTKIYVNYTAVADITQIDLEFYEQIYGKSVSIEGIHYADPIFLRMMMFLELSRPRGMVTRWEKVYERLALLDAANPLKKCRHLNMEENEAAGAFRGNLLQYVLKNQRVFMGADIHGLYKKSGTGRSASSRMKFLLQGHSPVIFLSPDAEFDGDFLSSRMALTKKNNTGYQNILPAMVSLYKGKDLVCLIIQEEACHAILSVPLTKHRQMRIASIDTMLTFLIGLYYRDDGESIMATNSLLCWVRYYIDLSVKYRMHPTKTMQSFPLECSGYQTTFASLLRAKAARIEASRQRIASMTRKAYNSESWNRRTRKRLNH